MDDTTSGAGASTTWFRRVLVVDDHRGFATMLCAALNGEPDLECVGFAIGGEAAMGQVAEHDPDIVLVDIQMPGQDGISVTRDIRAQHPGTEVVVMTAHPDPVWRQRAADAGAAGFALKNGDLDQLLTAVRDVVPAL